MQIHNSWVVRSIHLGRGGAVGTWKRERILKEATTQYQEHSTKKIMKIAIHRNENTKILKAVIIKMDKKYKKKYLSDIYFNMIMTYDT